MCRVAPFFPLGESVNPIDIARVGRCCDDYDDPMYAAYRECTLALDAEGCPGDAWSECEGTPDGTPASGEGDTDDDASQEGEVADRGCTLAATPSRPTGWLAGLALLLAYAARRRRTT